ncbi:VCBS repeat-containing protein [candidate division WOR-3 bacterium]|nr:VCBS repeat-containing protein [candidate division WOR-3 bacterium]
MRLLVFVITAGATLYGVEFEAVDIADLGIDELAGSASFVDYNSDGYLDFWAGYAYLNDGTGHFTKLTNSKWAGGEIVCWGDCNSDGYPDALTSKTVWIDTTPRKDTCWIILYENTGPPDFKLVDVSEKVGLGFPILDRDLNDPAWLDYDGDGLLDFFYSSYEFVPLNSEEDLPYWSGHEDYLFRNTGAGFQDVSDAAGIRAGGTDTLCARGVSIADFDNDGDVDIFVSVYRLQPNILWQNQGDGTFINVAQEAGVIGIYDEGYYGHNIGAAWGDYTNDGYLDLFTPITHHPGYAGDPTGHLWSSDGPPSWTFTDLFAVSGMENTEIGSAPIWGDYDNDGDLDLYWLNLYGQGGKQGWLYRNDGDNKFTDASAEAGTKTWGSKSYVVWADIDHDGKLDLYSPYTTSTGTYRIILMNTAERGHWLELDFEGSESNSSGIGTRVSAFCGGQLVMREAAPSCGNGYGSMYVSRQHLGLGEYETIDSVIIRWPKGRIDRIHNLAPDRVIGMVEGPPSAPEVLVYTWLGGDKYEFGWSKPPERDVAGYRLWQRHDPQDPWHLLADSIPAESTTFVVMMEPPLSEVSVTAYDYCLDDSESPHSALAVAAKEADPLSMEFEVGSHAHVIPVRFSLTAPSEVTISIYDPSGQRVRQFLRGFFLSGTYDLYWPGIDDEGQVVPSGVFFVRLSAGSGTSITRKIILR